ncbi:glycosyltransferase [Pseudomonas orientalis]|uniref:glycosyltransferase n=1 Tax=Pseudomonas orientalis TaxID=76758 RepID=UPI001A9370D6|nr:glycosyltransferase [Pseudomonas orientalis]
MTNPLLAERLPLVSIAIPAHNPRFFEVALNSAINQCYANIEIVVTDDCRGDGIRLITERLAAQTTVPVRYLKNEQQLGGLLNLTRGLEEARGEYIKFLNDDDVLLTDCVTRMAAVLDARADISLVTSRRRLIDAQGETLPDILETSKVFDEDVCLHGADLTSLLCDWPINFIGEPTTVMFRRVQVIDKVPNICALGGVLVDAINDLALYVNLLQHGHLAFLSEPLSLFRHHVEQRQKQPDMQDLFNEGRARFVKQIRALGLYNPQPLRQVRRAPLSAGQAFQLFRLREAYLAPDSLNLYTAGSIIPFAEQCEVLFLGQPWLEDGEPPIGVVIHAYYPGELQEILRRLTQLNEHLHLYVTCVGGNDKEVGDLLAASGLSYSLYRVPNHGRDILPFLRVLPFLRADNIQTVVKLHTKRSLHMESAWAQDLFNDLLNPVRFRESVEYLADPMHHPLLGTEPYRQAVAKNLSEANYSHLLTLAKRAGIDPQRIGQADFFAGTMFFVRREVLAHLEQMHLTDEDFETECGQLDGTMAHALERFFGVLANVGKEQRDINLYRRWLDTRQLSAAEFEGLPARLANWQQHPNILVVLTDTTGDIAQLRSSLESIDRQLYGAAAIAVLSNAEPVGVAAADNLVWLPLAECWPSQLNELLQGIDVDWCYLLRGGDQIDPHALLLLAEGIALNPGISVCYSDEDTLTPEGCQDPIFKPDLNLDLLRSYPYVGRALAFNRTAALDANGFDLAFAELAPHDLLYRLIEINGLGTVGHLSEVLVHHAINFGQWLVEPQVVKYSAGIVEAHLQRLGVAHELRPGPLPMVNRVIYQHTSQPLVSIVIPTKDQLPMLMRCVESVMEKTRYTNFELIIVDNNSETVEAQNWFAGMERLNSEKVRILRYPHAFNYSAINNFAVSHARGDYLVLLNNDTAVIDGDWLGSLLHHAQRPEVGIVGSKLLFPDGTIQHAGVVLGLRGLADHAFVGAPMQSNGYLHRLQVDQNYSAVTAACLMIRTELYRQVGGMDETSLGVSYNDVDLCLKVGQAGQLIVWTPYALLMHEANVSQNKVDKAKLNVKQERFKREQSVMYEKWLPQLAGDPAYNPNLTLERGGFGYECRSEVAWQPLAGRSLPYALCCPSDPFGIGHYRVRQPFAALEAAGLIGGTVSNWLLRPVELHRLAPDTIIFQRQCSTPQLEIMQNTQAFSKAFKVFELDDYILKLPSSNPSRELFPKDIAKRLKKAAGMCDRLVVSTQPLADALKGFNADIRVVENRLPIHWWSGLTSHRQQGRKPRVGWAGGSSHGGDLLVIADVVRELAGEVEWVFMGMCPPELRPYVHEFHNGVNIERYPAQLANLNLDLALAPLEDNFFNACKSNLRLLEYGACGFPVICSDILCYRGDLPVTRVRNKSKEWIAAIREHLADPSASAAAGEALRSAVVDKWMLRDEHLVAWRNAWFRD